ncbi:VOC family protein [Streptomyces sp. NPDC088812]|uniref:VOC family protein n=1 Tax=Streptomyces sp. NPDC088812 TaxID=3365905 RepID=UPI003804F83A
MTRFDHVGISVPDLEAAASWYRAALGLTAAPVFAVPGTDLRGVMLLHPSGWRVELLHRPSARPGPAPGDPLEAAATHGFGHMCLCVEDVAAEFGRLVAAGAGIGMTPRPAPRPGALMAFVTDPYGNLIELLDRT